MKTLVFGASTNSTRYSYLAMKRLQAFGHEVVAIGGRSSTIDGINILTGHPTLSDIDTITMYMGESRQKEHEAYLLNLNPRRIIFNPGAENPGLYKTAQDKGIEAINACTLVMLNTHQY